MIAGLKQHLGHRVQPFTGTRETQDVFRRHGVVGARDFGPQFRRSPCFGVTQPEVLQRIAIFGRRQRQKIRHRHAFDVRGCHVVGGAELPSGEEDFEGKVTHGSGVLRGL